MRIRLNQQIRSYNDYANFRVCEVAELRSQPLQSVSTLEMDLSTASEVYCCLSAAVTKLYLLAQTYEALHACQNTVCIYLTLASNSPELTDKFLEDDF